MGRVNADLERRRAAGGGAARTVVIAHAFVAAGAAEPAVTSHSERDIRVGGVDYVPSQVFDGIHYVALGHLHGPQQPRARDGGGVLRYSGSPLRYSFSEAAQQKSVTIVDLGPDGVTDITAVDLPQPRSMARLVGTIDELLHDSAHEAHRDSWVQATVTDSGRPQQMRERVLARFPHLLDIRHLPVTTDIGAGRGVANPAGADPVAVVGDFVVHVTGSEITDAELAVFRVAHEVVLAAGREA
jgi:exonuclease SbcD